MPGIPGIVLSVGHNIKRRFTVRLRVLNHWHLNSSSFANSAIVLPLQPCVHDPQSTGKFPNSRLPVIPRYNSYC